MDLSREDFSNHKYSEHFFPPVLSPHIEGFPEYEEIGLEYPSEIPFKSTHPENQRPVSSHRAQANKVLDRLLKKISGNDLPGKQYLAEYLRNQYRRNCRGSTLRNTHRSVEIFLKFLGKKAKSRLEEMTKWDMEAFVEHEQDRGLKLSTVRTQFVTIKAFIGYLIEKGVLDHNVFPWKMKLKPPETLPRAMDPDDVDRLVRVKASVRDRAMIMVLLRTGMRVGELLNMKLHDINQK